MDGARLDQRAREEGLHAALGALRSLTAEISAGREIEEWEIVELGRAVAAAEGAMASEFGSLDADRLRQAARDDERRASARRQR